MNKPRDWVQIGGGKDGTIYQDKNDPSILYKDLSKKNPYNGCSLKTYDDRMFYAQELSSNSMSNKRKLAIPRRVMNLRLYNLVRIYELVGDHYFSYDKAGYYMEYYEPVLSGKVDKKGNPIPKLIIDFPLEYIIRNYYTMEETLQEMWKKGIVIGDLFHENYICTKDKIVLIDIDSYNKVKHKDRVREFIGMEPHSYKYDANKIFRNFIRESLELAGDQTIVQSIDFYRFYDNPEYSFIEDIQNYDPKMTLREYLRTKTQELNLRHERHR